MNFYDTAKYVWLNGRRWPLPFIRMLLQIRLLPETTNCPKREIV